MTMNSQSLSKVQVLIVGCGDIGERFAKILPDIYVTTGLRRHPPLAKSHLGYQACDATDANQLDVVIQQGNFDVILVTMTPSERSDAGYERAYVQTCKNLIASLRRCHHRPCLLMFVSSTGVYAQDDGSWVDESSITEPDSYSGKRLLEAEKIITNSEFVSVIVRFSGIYGPGRNWLIDRVRQGRASLSPHFTNRIHADDGAAALAHLIELQRREVTLDPVYIVTDSSPVSMAEVVGWLAQRLKIKNFVGTSAAGERSNKRCSNEHLLATGFTLRYPSYTAGYSAVLKTP